MKSVHNRRSEAYFVLPGPRRRSGSGFVAAPTTTREPSPEAARMDGSALSLAFAESMQSRPSRREPSEKYAERVKL